MSLGAPELATQAYWDSRYEGEDKDGYDWFKTYADLAGFFKTHLQETSRILVLGCGTSALTTELYEQGYKHITSMDFSPVAIDIMKRQNVARPELSFDVMDIRDLSYENASFDFAIDKGTMDAMLCYKGDPWNPPDDVVTNCQKEISEAARVLRPGGKFLMISFRPAHFLRPRIQCDEWASDPVITQIGDFYFSVVAEKRQ